ncbi:hypothetical protein B0J13DRAFT_605432 [Dactylonectria estremocensis]|uniref:Uncharacterized protein n=1 Tax=Dactylonectria estremocensis TaxID=1079267 RepID=A0A9P9F571_9HYPO|nr:hypothetical protein B0J13DRAFT_605432 [Dactylonectria estremocensis]
MGWQLRILIGSQTAATGSRVCPDTGQYAEHLPFSISAAPTASVQPDGPLPHQLGTLATYPKSQSVFASQGPPHLDSGSAMQPARFGIPEIIKAPSEQGMSRARPPPACDLRGFARAGSTSKNRRIPWSRFGSRAETALNCIPSPHGRRPESASTCTARSSDAWRTKATICGYQSMPGTWARNASCPGSSVLPQAAGRTGAYNLGRQSDQPRTNGGLWFAKERGRPRSSVPWWQGLDARVNNTQSHSAVSALGLVGNAVAMASSTSGAIWVSPAGALWIE